MGDLSTSVSQIGGRDPENVVAHVSRTARCEGLEPVGLEVVRRGLRLVSQRVAGVGSADDLSVEMVRAEGGLGIEMQRSKRR